MHTHCVIWNFKGEFLRNMAPRVGFEPTTYRLTADCSAIELPRNIFLRLIAFMTDHSISKQNQFAKPKFLQNINILDFIIRDLNPRLKIIGLF